jgi:ppGpp synthetase/RelA/SpoT-type nucleotidyltranferase
MTAQVLDSNLQSAGIRAIVTSRAKSPVRLETKVRQRAQSHAYVSVDDIYDDIVDLAGVRVAHENGWTISPPACRSRPIPLKNSKK